MGRKSEKKKMERRIIISGVEYQIKRIRFNSFEGRENGFQIQLAIYPRKKWKFVLYDKDIQQFIQFVLDQYIKEGIGELDQDKLPDLLELKYHAVREAADQLGGVARIRDAFIGFQRHLY